MLSAKDRSFYRHLAEQRARTGGSLPSDIVAYRAMFEPMEAAMNASPLPSIGTYFEAVPIREGLTTAVATPVGDGPFPVLVHCHGNGGLAGSAASYRRFSYDCAARGFLTFMIDFRLAPEHLFPAGFDDMLHSLSWVSENAAYYRGDASKLCLSGNSSGAGMAFAVERALSDRPSAPRLRGLVGLDGRYDRTRDQTPGLEWMLEAYLGAGHEELASDPRVSPGGYENPECVPPILIIGGSADHTAPSTVAFAKQLLDAHVAFDMRIFEGTSHDFMRWPELDAADEGLNVMFDFLHACVI